jgi:hypothetical protein
MDLSQAVTDPLTNPAYLLFASIMPIFIALVKQAGLPKSANALLALAVYVVVGGAAVLFSGEEFSLDNLVPAITTLTVVGSAAYGIFWNQIGAGDGTQPSLDTRITTATSIKR